MDFEKIKLTNTFSSRVIQQREKNNTSCRGFKKDYGFIGKIFNKQNLQTRKKYLEQNSEIQ